MLCVFAEATHADVQSEADAAIIEVAQRRLSPGQFHRCTRVIGQAEAALEKTCKRLPSRSAFSRLLPDQSVWMERIAELRIMINQCRLLALHAAEKIDKFGNKKSRKEIAMIDAAGPKMLGQVIERAIQAHGEDGVISDFGLSYQYARSRVMRLADDSDAVHRNQIAKLDLSACRKPRTKKEL
jgi:acyl-CoA dehydrogenase